MKYISLIYEYAGQIGKLSETEYQALLQQHKELQKNAENEHAYISANQLAPLNKAVSVRIRNGESLVTDGPFTESKEVFVGYYVFDCADLDIAIQWAKMIPTQSNCGVEIRPIDSDSCSANKKIRHFMSTLNANITLYSLLIYQPEVLVDAYSAAQQQELIQGNIALANRAITAGDYVTGTKLMSPVTATSVRGSNAQQQITDGPFTEAKEVLLGQHILACKTIGDAIAYAEYIPDALTGVVEVRPIKFYEQIGKDSIQWINSV